ncbi:uncharacterized protein BKA78DRAFT_300767 [Phyllosticta capitalensis]|uniref:uncharacterized protein n=1 Tax=Phyllosticta capitalensis TaxID=121624 RepID=UPI003132417F
MDYNYEDSSDEHRNSDQSNNDSAIWSGSERNARASPNSGSVQSDNQSDDEFDGQFDGESDEPSDDQSDDGLYIVHDNNPDPPADPNVFMIQLMAQNNFLANYVALANSFNHLDDDVTTAMRRAIFYFTAAFRMVDIAYSVFSLPAFGDIWEAIGGIYMRRGDVTGIPGDDDGVHVSEVGDMLFNHIHFHALQHEPHAGNPFYSAWSLRSLQIRFLGMAYAEVRRVVHDGNFYMRRWGPDVQAATVRAINELDIPGQTYHIFVDN